MFYIQTNELLMQPLAIKRQILCVLGCHKVIVYMKGTFQSSRNKQADSVLGCDKVSVYMKGTFQSFIFLEI